MSHSSFKLTILAAGIAAATSASAAIYDVVEVTGFTSDNENYGVAVQQGTNGDPLGCFANGTTCTDYAVAVETRTTEEAVSYREEVPFAMDNSFSYVDDFDGLSDFESYCYRELRYDTCDDWAKRKWETWQQERDTFTAYLNAKAYVNGNQVGGNVGTNTVVNGFVGDTVQPFGNSATSTAWAQGYNGSIIDTNDHSRIWFNDNTYTAGSVSEEITDGDKPYLFHSSQAYIAKGNDSIILNWGPSVPQNDDDRLAQGSARAVQEDTNGDIYAVGFNTYTDQIDNGISATIFFLENGKTFTTADDWASSRVSGTENEIGGDYTHSNSVATDLNDKFVAIGEAKRQGGAPENGAANNRLFFIDDVRNGNVTATFFTGDIFFSGAGGTAAAINNFNEVVGEIDAETSREVGGKERRSRGYINPLNLSSSESSRVNIFGGRAWWLDDLTNDGVGTVNNQYRIISATDINDDGVISATAIKCDGGYDTDSHNSYCGGGNQDEILVPVKLVPRVDAESTDISVRSTDQPPVERSGGSLGFALLTLFGLFSFRRK